MANQTCLNIIPIKFKILRVKFGLKCLKIIDFEEEFKNMSNLMKNTAQTDNRIEPYLSDLLDP